MVETQLAKCILVLEKFIPGFRLTDIEATMDRQGIQLPPNPTAVDPETGGVVINPMLGAVLQANAAALGMGAPTVKTEPIVPSLSSIPSVASGSMNGTSSGPVSSIPPPLGTARGPESAPDGVYEDARRPHSASVSDVKGQDPHANDLSNTSGLIKAFGVSRSIVKDLPKPGKLYLRTLLVSSFHRWARRGDMLCMKHKAMPAGYTRLICVAPVPRGAGPIAAYFSNCPHQSFFTSQR